MFFRLPKALRAFAFFGLLIVIFISGIKLLVIRKTRQSQAGLVYLEDTATGNGTRYRVLQRKEDTSGLSFTVEMLIRGDAPGMIRGKPGSQRGHLHPHQQETLVVRQGRLGYWVGHAGSARAAGPGERVVFRPGEAHSLWNDEPSSDLVVETTMQPGGTCGEAFYETVAALGREYESPLAVSPLQMLLSYCRCGWVPSDLGPGAWGLVEGVLAPVAEVLGYKATYRTYTSAGFGGGGGTSDGDGSGAAQADGAGAEGGLGGEAEGVEGEEGEEAEEGEKEEEGDEDWAWADETEGQCGGTFGEEGEGSDAGEHVDLVDYDEESREEL